MKHYSNVFLFCVLSFFAVAQNSEDQNDLVYIRIQLNDLTTQAQIQQLDQLIGSKPGVLVTRTDRVSDTFYARYLLSSGLTESQFASWIISQGFEVKCTVTGFVGEPLKSFPENCLQSQNLNSSK